MACADQTKREASGDEIVTEVLADDIPVANTPGCGYESFPPAVLDTCTEALIPEAPDLRGFWQGELAENSHFERVEQCGNRVVITGGGVIHDMRADGTLENGVNDVAAASCAEISVSAEFVSGRLELRPFWGEVMVTRERDGEELLLNYGPFTAYLQRVEDIPE